MPKRRSRRLARAHLALLLAMTYGTTIALLLVTAGFVLLGRQGAPVTAAAHGQGKAAQGHGAASGHQGNAPKAGSAPDIRVTAEHRGGLLLEVKAEVSMNADRDPLIRAKAMATVDMADMPGAHTKGPIVLKATAKPGEYTAGVPLPMPGDYKVRVVVESPVHGEGTTTARVGLTGSGGRTN